MVQASPQKMALRWLYPLSRSGGEKRQAGARADISAYGCQLFCCAGAVPGAPVVMMRAPRL